MRNCFKKSLAAAAAALTIALTAGCGTATVNDQFVFGKNRIYCDDRPITITTPFELGYNGKPIDFVDHNMDKAMAEGQNRHMMIFVTGNKLSSENNMTALGNQAEQILKNNPHISDLKTTVTEGTVGDRRADIYHFNFMDSEKGEPEAISVIEYIFQDDANVWRVIYQYRTNDPVGKALTEKVAGNITWGATF